MEEEHQLIQWHSLSTLLVCSSASVYISTVVESTKTITCYSSCCYKTGACASMYIGVSNNNQ